MHSLLATQTPVQEDEDFSWDAEEDEPKSPETIRPKLTVPLTGAESAVIPAAEASQANVVSASTNPVATTEPIKDTKTKLLMKDTSPRESEESYDVLSSQHSVQESGNMSQEKEKEIKEGGREKEGKEMEGRKDGDDSGDDSDWE